MSRQHNHPDHLQDSLPTTGDAARAPGKRTLTAGIPTLRGRERDVASFDASSELREDRATIDGPPPGRLTERQIRKARRRNPHWQQRLGFSTATFGGGDIASAEFAENVGERQASLGVGVDGIAGPKTIAAVTAATPDADEDNADEGADADGGAARDPLDAKMDALFDAAGSGRDQPADDPFGMHLLGGR
jgi:hypothetical protein